MSDDVKRQIGILIEQASDPEKRAILLVIMNMNECLTETSKVNQGLLTSIEALKTQVSAQTAQRKMIVRAMDKILPYIMAAATGAMGYGYAQISEINTWKTTHTEYHRVIDDPKRP